MSAGEPGPRIAAAVTLSTGLVASPRGGARNTPWSKAMTGMPSAAARVRILVVGDVMLDQFIWGSVSRISPEAPVPVLDFSRESFMPGGAANVARNLVSLATPAELFGAIGNDDATGYAAVPTAA